MIKNLLIILLLLSQSPTWADELEPVSLQLKWTHAFQFAGYYAAKELGYYREVGLDVTIKEALPGMNVIHEVISGNSQFGVGTSSLLLARKAAQPVVVLAVIFQHSPQVIISGKNSGIQSIHDLKGKHIMFESASDELLAYLKREGIPLESLNKNEHSFNVDDLIHGKIDAISAYATSEPYFLQKAGFDYQIYMPRSAGIDFYGDNLFTSEQEIREHPQRVKDFRTASLKGWAYALAHPQEIIELILNQYSQNNSRDYLEFEVRQMTSLIRDDLIEVGYMNPGRWRHIAETYAELGIIEDGIMLDDMLYQPDSELHLLHYYPYLVSAIGLIGIGGIITVYIFNINRKLTKTLTEIQAANSQLQILSTAIEQSPTSIVITRADTTIEYVNPFFTQETGYSRAEVIGKNPRILQSGLTPPSIFQDMWTHLSQGEQWTGELINRRKSGEIYWEQAHLAPIKDQHNQITHYVAVKLDISEHKHALDQLQFLAHHDGLTRLPNRTLFFDRVTQGIISAQRNQTTLALMFIDLDKFKPINDQEGHAVGDQLLIEVAQRISACIRDSDSAGRIGGDEFVVLLLDVGLEDNAMHIANKIREKIYQPILLNEKMLSTSASIGIGLYPVHGVNEIELGKHADRAMYAAKHQGGNLVKVFEASMAPDPTISN